MYYPENLLSFFHRQPVMLSLACLQAELSHGPTYSSIGHSGQRCQLLGIHLPLRRHMWLHVCDRCKGVGH